MPARARPGISFWRSRLRGWPLAVRHWLYDGGSNSPRRGSPTERLKSVLPEHRIAPRSTIGFVQASFYEPSTFAFSDPVPDAATGNYGQVAERNLPAYRRSQSSPQ